MIEQPLHLEPEQFDELVSEVMDELPEEWGPILDNMAVIVEEEPGEDDLADGATADDLFGRYRRTAASFQFIGGGLTAPTVSVPPEIALFQGPIERASASMDDLRETVRETLIQEIGRYLGLQDEDDLADEDDEGADEEDEDTL